jgi:dipeptidyl aminopeptidase/acylaminoacyl peptidase
VLCVNVDSALAAPNYDYLRIPPGKPTWMEYTYDGYKSAVELLLREGVIKAGAVGISGLSFFANVVNWIITQHPEFAAAATAAHVASTTEPYEFYIYAGMGRNWLKMAESQAGVVDPRVPEGARHYQLVSDVLNAARICTPLLVQTDAAEFGGEGIEYYAALKLNSAPAEIIVFPQEAHNFWQPEHILIVEDRNIDWFRYWLQHYESPITEKRGRYARWDVIRKQRERVRTQRAARNVTP